MHAQSDCTGLGPVSSHFLQEDSLSVAVGRDAGAEQRWRLPICIATSKPPPVLAQALERFLRRFTSFRVRIRGGAGDLPNPLEAWVVRPHGLAAFARLFLLGALAASHVPPGWRITSRRRRSSPRGTVRATWMVPSTGVGHALDHKQPMACHVHLDAAWHAQPARTFRRVVDMRQRILKLRVIRTDHATSTEKRWMSSCRSGSFIVNSSD